MGPHDGRPAINVVGVRGCHNAQDGDCSQGADIRRLGPHRPGDVVITCGVGQARLYHAPQEHQEEGGGADLHQRHIGAPAVCTAAMVMFLRKRKRCPCVAMHLLKGLDKHGFDTMPWQKAPRTQLSCKRSSANLAPRSGAPPCPPRPANDNAAHTVIFSCQCHRTHPLEVLQLSPPGCSSRQGLLGSPRIKRWAHARLPNRTRIQVCLYLRHLQGILLGDAHPGGLLALGLAAAAAHGAPHMRRSVKSAQKNALPRSAQTTSAASVPRCLCSEHR